ncbi:MAG: hypothetical protein B6D59_04130 [Campylobacteraceae bacterium 4484_4]|nr:MAG: hypothetical protein B6D59_04130 [Campylobacteraceae bacterium 4484_4]
MQSIDTEKSILSLNCQDRCSLSLLALLLLKEPEEEILFLSSQNYLLVKSELVHLKMTLPHFAPLVEKIRFFFLKRSFRDSKSQIINALEEVLRTFEGTFIYFDRIDYYLDCDDEREIKRFFHQIAVLLERYDKKVIFIYGTYGDSVQLLQRELQKYSQTLTLNSLFATKKDSHMPHTETLQNPKEVQDISDETLVELSLLATESHKQKPIQMMLISDNDEVKKLNYYLFREVDDIDYYTVDMIDETDMQILNEMDIVVYNKDDGSLKKKILDYIKSHHLRLKFFYISSKSYIRQKDLLKEHILGVDKVLKLDFLLEDYILSMEKNLHTNFYSQRVLELQNGEKILYDEKDAFERRVKNLMERQIFFSLLQYHYDAEIDIKEYNLKKIVREFDTIYIDRKRRTISFCLLNVLPQFASTIIGKRINNFSITLHEIDRKSAFDLLFEQEG